MRVSTILKKDTFGNSHFVKVHCKQWLFPPQIYEPLTRDIRDDSDIKNTLTLTKKRSLYSLQKQQCYYW